MGIRFGKTIAEVARELDIAELTIRRWEAKGLVEKKLQWDERQQKEIRLYSEKDIVFLKWLKKMGGSHQSNEFYIKMLAEYIKTGKIDPSRLGWPMK